MTVPGACDPRPPRLRAKISPAALLHAVEVTKSATQCVRSLMSPRSNEIQVRPSPPAKALVVVGLTPVTTEWLLNALPTLRLPGRCGSKTACPSRLGAVVEKLPLQLLV